jgi:hypothetical protein
MVRYEPVKHPTLNDTPWVLATPGSAGVIGLLVSYPPTLREGRVNGSDGLVLRRTGARIVWTVRGSLVARRLDGRGVFRAPLYQRLRFPSAGCWRLTIRHRLGTATVVARVVTNPLRLGCDATKLESGSAFARPRSSGIRGGWPWQTSGPAQLTTHGHDGDRNMKVLWSVRRNWGASLELVGTRLDARGTFKQEFPMAVSPVGFFPSTVDVPAAGCWLFRLRTGRLAGVLVVRAVDR